MKGFTVGIFDTFFDGDEFATRDSARPAIPAATGGQAASLGGRAPAFHKPRRERRAKPRSHALLLAACFALTPTVGAAGQTDTPSASVHVLDLPLTDQDGRSLRFASEAVGKSVVAINFIYTSCTTLCPLTSATFKNVQSRLKNRLGKDVRLISMSLDPATDTPARLKAYAARYKAGPGWLWLTGEPGNMKQVLTGLGAYTASIQEHPPQVLVGDGASGQWTSFNTLPGPDRIRAAVEQYLKARHD